MERERPASVEDEDIDADVVVDFGWVCDVSSSSLLIHSDTTSSASVHGLVLFERRDDE